MANEINLLEIKFSIIYLLIFKIIVRTEFQEKNHFLQLVFLYRILRLFNYANK